MIEDYSPGERPRQASNDYPAAREGFKAWMAHVDAGRIGAHVGKAEAQATQPAAPAVPVMRTFGLNSPEAHEFFGGEEGVAGAARIAHRHPAPRKLFERSHGLEVCSGK